MERLRVRVAYHGEGSCRLRAPRWRGRAALLLCHCGSMVALSRFPGILATVLMEEERGLGLVAARKGEGEGARPAGGFIAPMQGFHEGVASVRAA